MGIGVSGPKLAAVVTNVGGGGVIAGVNLGYMESDFVSNTLAADLRDKKPDSEGKTVGTKEGWYVYLC